MNEWVWSTELLQISHNQTLVLVLLLIIFRHWLHFWKKYLHLVPSDRSVCICCHWKYFWPAKRFSYNRVGGVRRSPEQFHLAFHQRKHLRGTIDQFWLISGMLKIPSHDISWIVTSNLWFFFPSVQFPMENYETTCLALDKKCTSNAVTCYPPSHLSICGVYYREDSSAFVCFIFVLECLDFNDILFDRI